MNIAIITWPGTGAALDATLAEPFCGAGLEIAFLGEDAAQRLKRQRFVHP